MAPSERIRAAGAILAVLAGSTLAGCNETGPQVRVVSKERTFEPVDEGFLWNASTERRLRLRSPAATTETGSNAPHWTTPDGWGELPGNSLRLANFLVAGDSRVECYLTLLVGDGGGLVANANRWLDQMSLAPLSEAEVEALPRAEFYGGEGMLIDVTGTYGGMQGEGGEGYRLVGLGQVASGEARFLKMVGPSSVVDGEVEAFLALAASFHGSHDDSGHDHGDGHDHGAEAPASSAEASNTGGGMSWQAPEGWRRAPDRMMRAVTFLIGENDETECYVAVLTGEAGGDIANVNRWRDQMGQPDLDPAEFAALERIPMLGREGVVVQVDGVYTGMGDELVEEAGLLGAVCLLDGSAVFVKLIGPRDQISGLREDFLGFCKSLEMTS